VGCRTVRATRAAGEMAGSARLPGHRRRHEEAQPAVPDTVAGIPPEDRAGMSRRHRVVVDNSSRAIEPEPVRK